MRLGTPTHIQTAMQAAAQRQAPTGQQHAGKHVMEQLKRRHPGTIGTCSMSWNSLRTAHVYTFKMLVLVLWRGVAVPQVAFRCTVLPIPLQHNVTASRTLAERAPKNHSTNCTAHIALYCSFHCMYCSMWLRAAPWLSVRQESFRCTSAQYCAAACGCGPHLV
jgi:hypothetical protein